MGGSEILEVLKENNKIVMETEIKRGKWELNKRVVIRIFCYIIYNKYSYYSRKWKH